MPTIEGISKSFGARTLFENVSFSITGGERIGLVGRNGQGKSTLAKIIAKRDEPDEGRIIIPSNYSVGFLTQHLSFTAPTVLEEACLSLEVFEGGWQETYRAESILDGLGFSETMISGTPDSLSGGYQLRLQLAKLLLEDHNLLILDEPTNYLDILAKRWLENFLANWKNELLLITHDRGFMDKVITHVVGLHRGVIKKRKGKTQGYYTQIAEEEVIHERTRLQQQKDIAQKKKFISKFRAKARQANLVQSRIKELAKIEELEALEEISTFKVSFPYSESHAKWALHLRELSFRYSENSETLINKLSCDIRADDRVAIIGANGKGKSTLLNLIAGNLTPTKGDVELSSKAELGFFGQTNIDRLDPGLSIEDEVTQSVAGTPLEHVSRTVIRSICGAMMFTGDDALKKIKVLSGGEKSRVLIAKLLLKPQNILLLDEPTHHLDQESVAQLVEAINEFKGAVVLVTHDEDVIKNVANKLIVFDGEAPYLFDGTYDDFLKRVGWKGEKGEPTKPESKNSSNKSNAGKDQTEKEDPYKNLTKKEIKKLKAERITQKAKKTAPLKSAIKKLEDKITSNENEVKGIDSKLEKAYSDGESKIIAELSVTRANLQSEIDQAFEEMNEFSLRLDGIEEEFKNKN